MKTNRQISISISCLLMVSWVLTQSSIDSFDTQRMDVVKVRASSGGSAETAAGIYVGKDGQNAYFVTANHPLWRHSSGTTAMQVPCNERVDTVELQFFSRPVGLKGRVLEHCDPSLDLAVVYIPMANLPEEMAFMPKTEASAQLAVHIIGHPPAGDWTAWTGRVQNERNVSGDSNFFSTGSDSSLTKGYSGAPVLDANGSFVGIHLSSTNSYGRNLKSDAMLKALRDWRVPATNFAGSGVGLVGTWRAPGGKPFSIHGYDAVALPNQSGFNMPNGSSWTLEAWVYPTKNPRSRHVVGKRDGCDASGFYQIAIDVNAPGTGMSIDPQFTPLNVWTQVAIVADGNAGWTSYANGRVVKTVNSPGWRIENSGPFLIGGSGTCNTFIGLIDYVSLFSRALSDSEIKAAYASQRPKVLLNPIEK